MPEDEPRTVEELLVGAKDVSELMVGLAYAAVYFNDEDLAGEVEHLRDRLDRHIRHLGEVSMLAAHSPEDASGIGAVLAIADAIQRIGSAASDIARVVPAKLGIPEALREGLRHAEEVVGRVQVAEDAPCVGRPLRDVSLPSETGMWLLAIRRGRVWTFDPRGGTVITDGDVLLYEGPEEGTARIRALAGASRVEEPEPDTAAPPHPGLDRAIDILLEMKDSAAVAVGLAYSALLLSEPALAAEVATLEGRSDVLHGELESWVLRAGREVPDPTNLRGLLQLASAGAVILDSARDISRTIEHGEELHPVIAATLQRSEEIATSMLVQADSPADGRSLGQLHVRPHTGMNVIAVQRSRRWIYRPRSGFSFAAGDRLIAVGPEDGAERLEIVCRTVKGGSPTHLPARLVPP
jgi:uncharacterized protein with PhoU and TrkA domain